MRLPKTGRGSRNRVAALSVPQSQPAIHLSLNGREYATPMLYVVEILCDREHLARVMSATREWLDAQRFEPDAFRCVTDEDSVVFRLEFKHESEAVACADAFGGQVSSMGDKPGG